MSLPCKQYPILNLSLFALLLGIVCGCRVFSTVNEPAAPQAEVPNPLTVPLYDRTLVMDEVSDELDDYFRVYKEERIRIVDNIMKAGSRLTRKSGAQFSSRGGRIPPLVSSGCTLRFRRYVDLPKYGLSLPEIAT
jgi:hypothetical protein